MPRPRILILLLLCFSAFAYEGTNVSAKEKPTPKANPMIIDGSLRLSILNEGCMRVEKGSFHDEPSMFAQKRKMDFFDFEIEDRDDQILVKTKKLIFFVDRHRFMDRFDGFTYGVDVPAAGTATTACPTWKIWAAASPRWTANGERANLTKVF